MVPVDLKVFFYVLVTLNFIFDYGFTQAVISQSLDITMKGANVTKVSCYSISMAVLVPNVCLTFVGTIYMMMFSKFILINISNFMYCSHLL